MSKLEYSTKSEEGGGGAFSRRPRFASPEYKKSRRVPLTESEQGATAIQVPLKATVISSVPLSPEEFEDLVDSLQHKYKCSIRAEVSVQPGVVRGVRVEIGGDAWDASPRPRVEAVSPPRFHAEHGTLNALRSGRGEERSEAECVASASGQAPQRSMHIGRAIVAPPIPELDRYEHLQSNLLVRYPVTMTRIMLVVGAGKGCGVSTAASSLAANLAQDACARVLLIDANVRSPGQSPLVPKDTVFDETDVSLSRLLSDAPVLLEPTPGPSNLYVLPSGVPRAFALSVFQSPLLDELLRKARELFKYVVIDGPALAEHPESLLLSRKASGVILVLESERTRSKSAIWAKRQIEMAGGTLLGVILNRRKYRIPDWLYKRM